MGDCGIMNLTVLNWLDHSAVSFAEKNAFSDKESTVTFAQLNAYTKSIGTYLARRVKPGSPVVVMSGRHVLTPACYLGVVRAGCFYAPMDATMPAARLNQILGVIKADTMLVDREHAELAKTLDFSGDILVMEDIMETPPEDELLENGHRRVTSHGTAPVLAEAIEAEIRIKTCHCNQRVVSIDEDGFITGKIPSRYENGELVFEVGKEFARIYYLIQTV